MSQNNNAMYRGGGWNGGYGQNGCGYMQQYKQSQPSNNGMYGNSGTHNNNSEQMRRLSGVGNTTQSTVHSSPLHSGYNNVLSSPHQSPQTYVDATKQRSVQSGARNGFLERSSSWADFGAGGYMGSMSGGFPSSQDISGNTRLQQYGSFASAAPSETGLYSVSSGYGSLDYQNRSGSMMRMNSNFASTMYGDSSNNNDFGRHSSMLAFNGSGNTNNGGSMHRMYSFSSNNANHDSGEGFVSQYGSMYGQYAPSNSYSSLYESPSSASLYQNSSLERYDSSFNSSGTSGISADDVPSETEELTSLWPKDKGSASSSRPLSPETKPPKESPSPPSSKRRSSSSRSERKRSRRRHSSSRIPSSDDVDVKASRPLRRRSSAPASLKPSPNPGEAMSALQRTRSGCPSNYHKTVVYDIPQTIGRRRGNRLGLSFTGTQFA